MFITERDANDRLGSHSNRLRDLSVSSDRLKDGGGRTDVAKDTPEGESQQDSNDVQEKGDEVGKNEESSDDSIDASPISEELDKLLDLNTLTSLIQSPSASGRANYRLNRPAQAAIAETAHVLGSQYAASDLFQLSRSQAEAYAHGTQSLAKDSREIPTVKARIRQTKEKIAELAAKRLYKVVDSITDASIAAVDSPLELARMGKDIATIVERMEGAEKTEASSVHFHIFQPPQAQEDIYQTVRIGSVIDVTAEKSGDGNERKEGAA